MPFGVGIDTNLLLLRCHVLPLLRDAAGGVCEFKVHEVTALAAAIAEKDVGGSGTCDQAVVLQW